MRTPNKIDRCLWLIPAVVGGVVLIPVLIQLALHFPEKVLIRLY
jgi:hypothetical protein